MCKRKMKERTPNTFDDPNKYWGGGVLLSSGTKYTSLEIKWWEVGLCMFHLFVRLSTLWSENVNFFYHNRNAIVLYVCM